MKTIYTPLPGLGTGKGAFRVGVRTRIYQAPDHLLLIESTGYTEEYRRVFYRDIRYVVIRRNDRYTWINLVVGVIVLFLCLLRWAGQSWIQIGVFCLPFLIFAGFNLVRGATCDCYVATHVQTVALATPQRVNKVSRLLDFLNAKIAEQPNPTALS